ncbi:MAG: phosphoglycerate kinase [Candidatus Paceibacterota bacterium]|jgi:3-phosphoglycerate kinase
MLNLRNLDVKNKKVLVRCDFNVPLDKNGQISDDFRIKKTVPTIKYLQNQAETIILMSHLGDPEGIDPKFSFAPLVSRISEIIGAPIIFLSEAPGPKLKKMIEAIKQPGAIVLLENLRFNSGEKENNPKFVESLASLGDIFVQEGFGVCHRAHASTYGLPQLLPNCAGFLLEQELNVFDKAMNNPARPFLAIIGGVKISTKTKLIQKLLEKADNILIGGKIANSILTVKGLCIKEKWSREEDLLMAVIDTVDLTSPKLHLPVDGLMALADLSENYLRLGAVGTVRKEENIFDIGPETIEKFKEIIKEAKTIIWNGPLGYYENSYFQQGTKEILKAIIESQAYSIIGGGDTVDIIHQMKMEDNFDYISTGGGAMLDYISGEELPGIKVLKNRL